MPRYVDADKVIDVMKAAYWDENIHSAKDDPCVIDAMIDWSIRQVKDVPTEDVEPVIHAHWAVLHESVFYHECSNCGLHDFWNTSMEFRLPDYCPDCGAKMDL